MNDMEDCSPYPENVKKIAKTLLEEINKYYPGLIQRKYYEQGYACKEQEMKASLRAQFCIYIELMKAGAFRDKTDN